MAAKNNLEPKKNYKNNIDKWSNLTGSELPLEDYTRDQIRALAATYKIKSYSSFTQPQLIEKLKVILEKQKKSYKTIFEIVKEKTKGESKSFSWYKNTVKTLASEYKKDQEKVITREKRDSADVELFRDENIIRKRVYQGHLYLFEYIAETERLPYYDKFPLVYVLKVDGSHFYGANLHYVNPKKRVKIVEKLLKGRIDIPKKIIHKYLNKRCDSFFLDLSPKEWDTSILLPIEEFVLMKGGGKIPYDKELVWEEMLEHYNDRLVGERIIKGQNRKDVERVK